MDKKNRKSAAIIGMSCRFPASGESCQEFWEMLKNKTDAISDIPAERWDRDFLYHPDFRVAGKMNVKQGGFLKDIALFDNSFFGISPIEAARMDPQQRLLLENSYLAFEDAGLKLEKLARSRTGVFIGISSTDYAGIQNGYSERMYIGPHSNTGNAASIAANRISYVFDLIGPSFAVDTACSSGLVAAHLALRSLFNQESEIALVGGVNIILKPELQIGFSKGGFLAPDSRSKTFDARANGYIRSEGVGVVLLKDAEKAQADGDYIYAEIMGSAINEDGKTGGIAMPSKESQILVLKDAYQNAGISPSQVSVVEAHGTGTAAGDPIECQSIGEVIGKNRESQCLIGSVKSNIGHLEPASGLAGLIKLALSLDKGKYPANIHFENPNPAVDFDHYKLKVPTEMTEIPRQEGPVFAGINSFGFGGANAHLVLRSQAEKQSTQKQDKQDIQLFLLSAKSEAALKALAKRYLDFLQHSQADFQNIVYSAALRRSFFDYRFSCAVKTREELGEQLKAFIQGKDLKSFSSGRILLKQKQPLVFVYSGQGPQWFAMGRELMEKSEIFRKSLTEIDSYLKAEGWLKQEKSSLLIELGKSEEESRINQTRIAQPAIFALQVALTRLWQDRGFQPDLIIGHSIGEVAASWASGALSLKEATRLVYWRSQCQARCEGKGRMLAAGLTLAEARESIKPYKGKIDIAAVNGPAMLTLSGEGEALIELEKSLAAQEIFTRFLIVDVPFHSFMMDEIKEDFLKSLGKLQPRECHIPLYSTVRADLISGKELTAEYWYNNIRESVHFYPAIEKILEKESAVFIEISPHPILSRSIEEAAALSDNKAFCVPSLRRKQDELFIFYSSIGKLINAGFPVKLLQLYKGSYNYIKLPFYAWQKEHFWHESSESLEKRRGRRPHPHLKAVENSAGEDQIIFWNIDLDKRSQFYIEDHRVQGPLVYPGAGHVDLALACALASFGQDFNFLEDLNFFNPLFLNDEDDPFQVRLEISSDQQNYRIASRKDSQSNWQVHSSGRINCTDDIFTSQDFNPQTVIEKMKREVELPPLFEELTAGGLMLGESFRGLKRVWQGDMECIGEIHVHESIKPDYQQFNIHPALLDASFQAAFGITAGKEKIGVYIPVHIDKVKFHRAPLGEKIYSYARAKLKTDENIIADISIMDADGSLLAEVRGFTAQYLKGSRGERAGEEAEWFYEYQWKRRDSRLRNLSRKPDDYLTPLDETVKPAQQEISRIRSEEIDRQFREDFSPALEELSCAYITDCLGRFNIKLDKAGFKIDPESLFEEWAIQSRHRKLFFQLFIILKQNNYLKEEGGVFSRTEKALPEPAEKIQTQMEERFSAFHYELSMLGRCAPGLKEVLLGENDPVQLIFPQNDPDLAFFYYTRAHSFAKYNRMIAAAFQSLIKNVPQQQTLRILEIGAGTGGVSQALFPLLPKERSSYYFTDLSPAFLKNGRNRFGDYPFIEYEIFDLEKDAAEQGFDPGSFDLVVASDVIHATRSISGSLSQIRKMLAPGAVLLVLEVTHNPSYLDLVFGMTEGWWLFEDSDLRQNHCVISQSQWLEQFSRAGFGQVRALSDIDEDSREVGQSIFLAQNPPEETSGIKEDDLKRPHADSARWIIFADSEGLAQAAARKLVEKGFVCDFVYPAFLDREKDNHHYLDFDDDQSLSQYLLKKKNQGDIAGLLDFWPLYADFPTEDNGLLEKQKWASFSLCTIRKAMLAVFSEGEYPPLYICTRDLMQPEQEKACSLFQAPVWGAGRVFINEPPLIPAKLIDLCSQNQNETLDLLCEEVLYEEGKLREEELALRGKRRYARRLEKRSSRPELSLMPASGGDWQLRVKVRGLLESLIFTKTRLPELGDDEVLLDPLAAALNFRDLMMALGMLPEKAVSGGIFGKNLGLECSAEIAACGKNVKALKKGDKVMALARACISGKVLAKADYCLKIPQGLGIQEAAGIPMAFLTAYYSLIIQADLEKGERVLIHSAAGGVGQAAIQIAKSCGAEIFATASPSKHALLKKQGIKFIYNSRDNQFYSRVMEDTQGEGVDIVLNSLAGQALSQSMRALASCGRFVEIGKSDIFKNRSLGMEKFGDNISWFVVDIDRLLQQKPQKMARHIREMEKFIQGPDFSPLPFTVFPIQQSQEAFRYFSASKQSGKILLDFQADLAVHPPLELALDKQAAYLVAGGNSGFGLEAARWLSKKGAGMVYALSRSGLKGDYEKRVAEDLKQKGYQIEFVELDITSLFAVKDLLARIKQTGRPLKGIINSAMVLEDSMMSEMDWPRYQKVLSPKMAGTWTLHQAAEESGLPLDFFINYSSIASMYGTPGQSNYAAANSFLDRFSFYRQAGKKKALTINWGVLGEVGFVSRTEKVRSFLSGQGWESMNITQALNAQQQLLLEGAIQTGAFRVDWQELKQTFPQSQSSFRFNELHKSASSEQNFSGQQNDLRKSLLAAKAKEARVILIQELKKMAGRIFGTVESKIDSEVPLSDMGLDSLMANQFRSWISGSTGVDYSMMQIMQGPSLQQIADTVLSELESVASPSQSGEARKSDRGKWIIIPEKKDNPKLRLFCFPYLGAGPSVFKDWQKSLGSEIELCLVHFPAREDRLKEKPFYDGEELIKAMEDELLPLLDRPFALYGHSFGASIAVGLGRYLAHHHHKKASLLLIAAAIPPSTPNPLEEIFSESDKDDPARLPAEKMKALLKRLGAPQALYSNEEYFQQVLPGLRGDLAISRKRDNNSGEKLDMPMLVLAGKQDTIYPRDLLSLWKDYADNDYFFEELDGGHLFLHEEKAKSQLLQLLKEYLEASVKD